MFISCDPSFISDPGRSGQDTLHEYCVKALVDLPFRVRTLLKSQDIAGGIKRTLALEEPNTDDNLPEVYLSNSSLSTPLTLPLAKILTELQLISI